MFRPASVLACWLVAALLVGCGKPPPAASVPAASPPAASAPATQSAVHTKYIDGTFFTAVTPTDIGDRARYLAGKKLHPNRLIQGTWTQADLMSDIPVVANYAHATGGIVTMDWEPQGYPSNAVWCADVMAKARQIHALYPDLLVINDTACPGVNRNIVDDPTAALSGDSWESYGPAGLTTDLPGWQSFMRAEFQAGRATNTLPRFIWFPAYRTLSGASPPLDLATARSCFDFFESEGIEYVIVVAYSNDTYAAVPAIAEADRRMAQESP